MNIIVSIIMPCYNGLKYLPVAIDSVRRQTLKSWELLVIDNNSTDGSLEYVESESLLDSRIVSLRCKEPGAANARNTGVQFARGRYIAFLDADDFWLPEKLQRQIELIESSGAVFCWSSYHIVNSAGNFIRDQIADEYIDYNSFMTKRSVVGCLTVIYDSQRLGKLFMPNIKMRQDYALWAKIIRSANEKNFSIIGTRDILASYRVHDESMTKNKFKAAFFQWFLYRRIEKLSFLVSVNYFIHYFSRGLLDRLIRRRNT